MGLILKENFCFVVNGRFESTCCVTLYISQIVVTERAKREMAAQDDMDGGGGNKR